MTLLHFDGFELNDSIRRGYGSSDWGQVGFNTNTPYSSGYSMFINGGYVFKNIVATQEVYVGVNHAPYAAAGTGAVLSLLGAGATVGHLYLRWNGTALELRRGVVGSGTLLATGLVTPPAVSQWKHIQVYAKIDDTVGRCTVKIDDLTVIDFTGDTRNGGATADVDQVAIGRLDGGVVCNWDDWWICNAAGAAPYNGFLGVARVRTLSPTGAGTDTGFTPSAGANWQCVDEQPYSAADYVTATGAVSGTRDTYATADLPGSGVGDILAVQPVIVAKKSGAAAVDLKAVLRSGGTVYKSGALAVGTTDVTNTWIQTADPATAAAWTISGVNALEVGVEVA